ncbi:MAG: TolB family protein, partial [Verrucomicrobiia bacterium]
ADRKHPGIQGPRHWLRSSPDGTRIAFLMKDDDGVVQIWTISPNGGQPKQLTRNPNSIDSAFSWSPDGRYIAHTMDRSVCVTDTESGVTHRLTAPTSEETAPRPEACVFSPDGKKIAYVRRVPGGHRIRTGDSTGADADSRASVSQYNNQVFVLLLE